MRNHFNLYVFVSVLFVVGGIFGALLVGVLTLEQQQELAAELGHYVSYLDAGLVGDAKALFWDRFWFHFKWLMLIWVLGITVVGIPGVLALNFLKGALVGFAAGVIVQQYAWKGILFFAASVVPQNLIAVPAIIVVSAAAISFGLFVVRNRLLQHKGELLPQFGSLTSTVIIVLLLLAGAAWLEAYISPALLGWVAPYFTASDGLGWNAGASHLP